MKITSNHDRSNTMPKASAEYTPFIGNNPICETSVKCINCNKYGHTSRNCDFPNVSYGVILFRFVGAEIEYLMISRRETYAMGEFIGERYSLKNINYLLNMFNNMTVAEREDIKKCTILELEEIYRPKVFFANRTVCNKSYPKYERLVSGIDINGEFWNLEKLVNSATKTYSDPEWGFPKGKKTESETDVNCAYREMREETNFSRDDYHLLDYSPLEENIIGENRKNYKYFYYIGMLTNYEKILEIKKTNCNQKYEISKIEWMTAELAVKSIRSYYPGRKAIIQRIDRILKREFFGTF
jgi:8-oxo-dGTP pyrophosphatase MutT (NUDIX family)